MRLEVLGLLVLRNVLEERGLVDEAFVARVALVRLVRLVTSVNELGRKKTVALLTSFQINHMQCVLKVVSYDRIESTHLE